MHFSARPEARQKSTRSPAGQTIRPQKATVSICFYTANPKPAKQVLSKHYAEMRFETPPRIFRTWRCVISDLCFRPWFLSICQKTNFSHKTCSKLEPQRCKNQGSSKMCVWQLPGCKFTYFSGFSFLTTPLAKYARFEKHTSGTRVPEVSFRISLRL